MSWSLRELAVVVFFLGYLAVQLTVPVVALIGHRPAQFGWQMYSGSPREAVYTVALADGSQQPADPRAYAAAYRPDVGFERHLPPHLCAVVPGAVAVSVSLPGDADARTHRCP